MKPGDKVRLTQDQKNTLLENDSICHVEEFGDCHGYIIDVEFVDYDDVWWNVRWEPSKLRYCYPEKGLQLDNREEKLKRICNENK